jgi:tRNA acetyltransferase TAN1
MQTAKDIHSGDSGIWVTCAKGREGKCVSEMRDLFNEYAEKMYPEVFDGEGGDGGEADGEVDIEKEIQAELNEMKKPTAEKLFTHVRVNLQCGTFLKPMQLGSIAS